MANLPSDLIRQIVDYCEPYFRSPTEREGYLLIALRDWDGFGTIDWSGSAYIFCAHLIDRLPPQWLQAMLRSLPGGEQERLQQLCLQIDRAQRLVGTGDEGDAQRAYQQTLIDQLSGPSYQLDTRFVALTLLVDKGPEADGIRFVKQEERRFNSLAELLAEIDERAVVLLGGPGSGKTTLLRRLQLEHAWEQLERPDGRLAFFVPLNGYRAAGDADWPAQPHQWLGEQWQLRYPQLPPFADLLAAGRLLLLLDGLNEMPYPRRDAYPRLIARWQRFLQRADSHGNRFVFSCRSLDYSAPLGSDAAPVQQVQVEPLSDEMMREFLQLHLAEMADGVWQALQQDPRQLALFRSPFYLDLLVNEVTSSGRIPLGRAALLTGFVRRALRREAIGRSHRLLAAGKLLSEDDRIQLLQQQWHGSCDLPQEGELVPQLELLAQRMQEGDFEHERGQVRVPLSAARELIDYQPADDMIRAGVAVNVLDKDVATRSLAYVHQLLQEYFAARRFAIAPDVAKVDVAWRADRVQPDLQATLDGLERSNPLPPLPATGWEETVLLAAAMVSDADQFVGRLLDVNLPLAARCAAAPDVVVTDGHVRQLQQLLIARCSDRDADLRARIAAAEALGELGDPRFERRRGAYGDYLLPPLIAVAGGSYTIGDDGGAYAAEKPAHVVEIQTFRMGRFPVTNAEYRLFIDAGGYRDTQWWQSEGARRWLRGEMGNEGYKKRWREIRDSWKGVSDSEIRARPNFTPDHADTIIWVRDLTDEALDRWIDDNVSTGEPHAQPNNWEDSRFNHQQQPVVGVSWFEARAYCAWLSAQTGIDFRLPTEAEWEAAARGKQKRPYAYGVDFDAARCNTFETHIRRTTPIGVFANGETPNGISDLSGNVWEWTSSQYRPYKYDADDGRENADDADATRTLRGGSWPDPSFGARALYRYDDHPGNRDSEGGFRLVCGPPSRDR